MIEVEAKVKIKNPKGFRGKIKKLAKFLGKEKKIDDYYTLESLKKYPQKSVRVRKLNGNYQVNIKNSLSYKNGVHAKREIELHSRGRDLSAFLKILKDLGFKKWLRKEKLTELYKIKENFHIEINHVKKLGWFLEVEYLSNYDEIEKARKSVLNVLKKLSIKNSEIIKSGYTKMLWDLK